jgi:uncharacterized protein YukE
VSILKELARIGNGIRSGVSDVPSLVTNILELDVHGAVTDTRKIMGDTADVLNGAGNLGIEMGSAPLKYTETLTKWADSAILSGAQLAIEAEKKLTGSGSIETGSEYWASSIKLQKAVETLIVAELEVGEDGWNGAASRAYNSATKAHRQHVSDVGSADSNIGEILKKEAEQIRQTREVLDSTSQALYDYGLATKAILAIPGANVAKVALADTLAATAALATTSAKMAQMVANSMENASGIRSASSHYEAAEKDTSGDGGGCNPFVDPRVDQKDLPSRAREGTDYQPRKETPEWGPPATPLPVESQVPGTYDLPADLPGPHITPPNRPPAGLPK